MNPITNWFMAGMAAGVILGAIIVLALLWWFDPTRGCDGKWWKGYGG